MGENVIKPLEDQLDSCVVDPLPSQNSCIYRVPEKLQVHNKAAYKPQIIAIGPYNRANESLHMENQKKRYFKAFLLRPPASSNKTRFKSIDLITVVKEVEKQAADCYHDVIVGGDEFLEMMILDGCFILELLIRNADEGARADLDDPIFYTGWMLSSLQHDLILLENQIPYVVLLKLFSLTLHDPPIPYEARKAEEELNKLVLRFFETILPYSTERVSPLPIQKLQGFRAKWASIPIRTMLPSIQVPQVQLPVRSPATQSGNNQTGSRRQPRHILDLLCINLLPKSTQKENAGNSPRWEFTRCAADLAEAGVKFKRRDVCDGLLDVQFNEGIFEIPSFNFDENTDVVLRNMIALEQCDRKSTHHITSYVLLLDILMNSERDVKVLCNERIIRSFLGDEKEMALIINDMCKGISVTRFFYDGLCNKCNTFTSKPWQKSRAVLMGEYFHNTWSITAVIVAGIILLATLLQSTYAVVAYHKPPK